MVCVAGRVMREAPVLSRILTIMKLSRKRYGVDDGGKNDRNGFEGESGNLPFQPRRRNLACSNASLSTP